MVSLNDGEDPHFRKAQFDPNQCPPECDRPCESICPALAIPSHPEGDRGVIDQRCYGCGRCVPICPHDRIQTHSHLSRAETLLPQLTAIGIQAIEIHTQTSHYTEFKHLWQAIRPYASSLQLLAISCPDGDRLIDYLKSLWELLQPLPCQLLWQLDGRPMSGDIGAGTTHKAIRLAQKVRASGLPGVIQLAGGTNAHTVPKLRSLGLLGTPEDNKLGLLKNPKPPVVGVAYGSYARVLLSPVLETLEQRALLPPNSSHRESPTRLDSHPELLWEAVQLARTLVTQLKRVPSDLLIKS